MKRPKILPALKIISPVFLLMLALAGCGRQEVLVRSITFEPAEAEVFVGDFKRVQASTFPHFADNESDLDFFVANKSVAAYDGTTLVGLEEGRTEIVASCGTVEATCPVRVFSWRISLDGVDYGVSKSTGRINYRGVTTASELEIELSHDTGKVLHQFTIWIRTDLIGQAIDFNEPVDGVSVSATYDVNKDGYVVSAMNTGTPLVFDANWAEVEGVSVVWGYVRVDRKGTGNTYALKAEFKLTNGFLFGAEWEGKLPVTI